MRPQATRRLTALAISAAITLGTAGPAFADTNSPSRSAAATARAPLPDATALLAQTEALGDMGTVTDPVTELLTATLKADDGQLPAADAEALKAKIDTAIAAVKETAPVPAPEVPAVPETPVEVPAVPETPVDLPAADAPAVEAPAVSTPVAPVAPLAAGPKAAAVRAAAPADVVTDALAGVEKAVAALLAAVTSGSPTDVVPQVTATLTSLVNLVVATVLGSGLPAADLAGLPTLPTLPVAPPELPVDTPELPAAPPVTAPELPVKPPVSAPELPLKPPLPVR